MKKQKSKFIQNVITLASGTALSQLISITFSPLITRLYGPEAFGVLGVFTSLMNVLTPVVALAYPIAIVLPLEDEEAKKVAKLSLYISIVFSVFISVLLVLNGEKLLYKLNMNEIVPYLMYVPIYLMLSACTQVARQWLVRKKQFKTTAHVSVIQSLFMGGSKTGIGFFSPGSNTLIVLTIIGEFFHSLLLWIGVSKTRKIQIEPEKSHKPIGIKQVAKKYKDFPFFRAPEVTINALSQSLPTIFLISFFGPASAGFYSLGKRLVALPSSLIANAVGEVFYPRITESAHRGEPLMKLILKANLSLAGVGLIPFALLILLGPKLFSIVFGLEWEPAGIYARWLSVWLYFEFINRPSVKALPILEAQGFHLVYSTIIIFLRFGAMYAGFFIYKSDIIAVSLYGIVGAFTHFLLIIIVLFIASRYDKRNDKL